MAHVKSTGSTKNDRDSMPHYLGVKITNGDKAKIGSIIIRQRGTQFIPGKNVGLGRDHTLFALKEGTVKFTSKRKIHFDNSTVIKKVVNVI